MSFWNFVNRRRSPRPTKQAPAGQEPTGQEPAANGARRLELVPREAAHVLSVANNNYLERYAQKVTSQDGEDGVIAEILRRMGINNGWCVEFGAWDGKFHSNTWDLVHNHGWKAVYIEPSVLPYEALTQNCSGLNDVYCLNSMVTSSGDTALDALLSTTPIPTDFDLLIADIDGNDFYVWQACEKYSPKIVMIEFNLFIPADVYFVKPENLDERASASLSAVCELAKRKQYEIICVIGGNAIFVKKEFFSLFAISDNRPTSMFICPKETKIFQGYDGTLMLAGYRGLNWRWLHDRSGNLVRVEIADTDIQVLPTGLRIFRPRLSYRNTFLDEHAGCLDRARVHSNQLLDFRHDVTSEGGEDGILKHIFVKIGIERGYCVEVGAYDGKTFSNTWTLINNMKWDGLLIESDEAAFNSLQALYVGKENVQTRLAEVATAGETSLDTILVNAGAPIQFDFLCIDVEGNDFHIWAALTDFRPKVVMVDFNPSISNDVIFCQEDDPEIHHGASLRAFVELAAKKGYELAAVTSWNAIFVQREVFPRLGLTDNGIDDMYYPIFETKIFQSMNHYLSITGCNRLMRHNYVFDLEKLQPLAPNIRAIPYFTEHPEECTHVIGLVRQLEQPHRAS